MKPGFIDVGNMVAQAPDPDTALSLVSSSLLGATRWMRGDEGELITALLDGIKRFREADYERSSRRSSDL